MFRLVVLGIDEPVRETFHASLKLNHKTLETLGLSQAQAVDRVERFRRYDEDVLKNRRWSTMTKPS